MIAWITSPWLAFAIGYVLGAVPSGARGPWALAAADLLKGALAPAAALSVGWVAGASAPLADSTWLLWLGDPGISGWTAAIGAFLGRSYPPFRFASRGKAILAAAGSLLVLAPATALAAAVGWFLAGLPRMAPSGLAAAGGPRAVLSGLLAATVAHLVLYPAGVHLWAAGFLVFLLLLQYEPEMDALLDDAR